MDAVALVGVSTGVIGAVVGAAGLIQAGLANKAAKEANKIAQNANRKADTANCMASDANEISSEANTIAKQALAISADKTEYRWRFQLDKGQAVLNVYNDSIVEARDVTFAVFVGNTSVAEGLVKEMKPFTKTSLDARLIVDEIVRDGTRIRATPNLYGTGKVRTRIHVAWLSETGVFRTIVADQSFSE